MKSVFRQSALDKISSVDQLDKTLKITSPLSWLALLGVTLIIVVVLIWSVIGTLPSTVTAAGMIVNANTSTNTIKAGVTGTVQSVARVGDGLVTGGENRGVVAVIRNSNTHTNETVYSNQNGWVSEVLVEEGKTVDAQTEILRIRPDVRYGQKEVAVCYISMNDAGKIKRGQSANIFLSSADGSMYGHMSGRVINVDASATSTDSIESVVGKGNGVANSFTSNGPVCAVTCEILPDSDEHPTKSHYWWSNEKGAERTIRAPEMCSIKIITDEDPPITKFLAKLKDIWENKQ